MPLDQADWAADRAEWQAECAASRVAAAAHQLDDTGLRDGEPCSLRWIYVHLIEEYARHNGHADLIREVVDGPVGWSAATTRLSRAPTAPPGLRPAPFLPGPVPGLAGGGQSRRRRDLTAPLKNLPFTCR